ncbi:GIY-YIG nuclease family protein [Sphingomonas sp. ID0503]|uniref:GIY-YIG nuclease family protein n=1 Tax=Sphingomonas sp. ID0503 TaxID=3399691 RepID=UPI003AFAB7AA
MSFWVYILECSDGRFYTGHTDDLEARVSQHQAGRGADFTVRRLPVRLVWADHAGTREEALAFERQLKGWSRAKKAAWIAQDWKLLNWLSRAPSERTAYVTRASTSLSTNGVNGSEGAPFVLSEGEGLVAHTHPTP